MVNAERRRRRSPFFCALRGYLCHSRRQTKSNHTWRAPDVYLDRAWAAKQREDVLNEMIKYVMDDTYNTLENKIGERKNHDSSTSRIYARGGVSIEYSSIVNDDKDILVSMIGAASLED